MESVPKIYHTSLPNLHALNMEQTKVIVEVDSGSPFLRGMVKNMFQPYFVAILFYFIFLRKNSMHVMLVFTFSKIMLLFTFSKNHLAQIFRALL